LGIGNDPSAPAPNTQHPIPLGIDVLDGLSSLVDKSLVRQQEHGEGEPRFTMLETLREYGRERLEESEELEAIRRAHAAYFLGFAEEAAPRLRGPEQATWFARLEIDHDDLWAVLEWAVAEGSGQSAVGSRQKPGGSSSDATGSSLPTAHCLLPTGLEVGLRLGAALWRFWDVRGYLWEGRARLEAVLALPGAAGRTAVRARALNAAGALAQDQSDLPGAAALHTESLEIARECGDTESMATALNSLGNVALEQGDEETATKRYEESLALWRELGDKNGIAMALHNLGEVARDGGDYETAARHFEESLTVNRQIGDQKAIAATLNNLGMVAMSQKAYERAAALLNESLRLFQQIGDTYGIVMALSNLAELVSAQGNLPRAAELHRECLRHCARLDNKQAIAGCLERLAGVLAALGRPLPAASLYGAAAALREALGSPLPESDRADYDRNLAAAQAAAEPGDWQNRWAHGRAMSISQAIAFAMEASAIPS
jgi:tetratricopeptide (TPR) repeat protein